MPIDAILNLKLPNTVSVDLSLYQNAGATMVQQLGYALAHINEYFNHIENNKASATNITFKVAVGSNYFFEIAKLRALLYDYNTNMLRTTTECMAAVLGSANLVCNTPYDAIYQKTNDFGNRIALNQLLLLKNESYFNTVSNAADGTYYIESLTEQLAEKALTLFKSIEKGGGFLKQLKDNTIQKKIKESATKEQQDFNDGKEVLVGTKFVKKNTRKTLIEPIIEKRLAEAVEQKRLNDE